MIILIYQLVFGHVRMTLLSFKLNKRFSLSNIPDGLDVVQLFANECIELNLNLTVTRYLPESVYSLCLNTVYLST